MIDQYGYIISVYKNNAIVIGNKYFTFLEILLRKNHNLGFGDKVFFGDGPRTLVHTIRKRFDQNILKDIKYDILIKILEIIIKDNEKYYIDFLNNAQYLTIRQHTLELLPGIGKKVLDKILIERKSKLFDNFDDFYKRMKFSFAKSIRDRIILELTKPNMCLFVKNDWYE